MQLPEKSSSVDEMIEKVEFYLKVSFVEFELFINRIDGHDTVAWG